MRVPSPVVRSAQTGCPASGRTPCVAGPSAQHDRLAAIERRIVAEEGPFHVGGRYYANAFDAERQRRAAAERDVRETERRAQWLARQLAGVTVTNGRELVGLALSVTARAMGQRLTPEQVAQVVAAARVLWHAVQDHAQDASQNAPQDDAHQHTANGRAA